MDNLTHTLFAVTLARTPIGRAGRGTTAALVVASNAPDIDIVSAARGGAASYMQWHRGPTHGLFGVIGLGLVVALGVWVFTRLRHDDGVSRPRAPLLTLSAISVLGVLLHILMDLPTSYGTRLLSPFDWRWYAFDWLPIVDIYLLIALVTALAFGRLSPEARRRNAAIALGLMALNYGVRATSHHRALAIAPRLFGPTLPQPCDPKGPPASVVEIWPRATSYSSTGAPSRVGSASRCLVEMAAMPTFFSPFRWRVIARVSNAYELQEVDVLDARFRTRPPAAEALWRRSLRFPNVWTYAVDMAARKRTAQIFLGFARFPAALAFLEAGSVATVRFTDMRFAGGIVSLNQPSGRASPFTLTIRIGAEDEIQEELAR